MLIGVLRVVEGPAVFTVTDGFQTVKYELDFGGVVNRVAHATQPIGFDVLNFKLLVISLISRVTL